jgi:hypothetical protein
MENLFYCSFTLRLPVYTMTLALSTTWEGFGRGRGSNAHWKDFALGFLSISFIHRKKYDEAINEQLMKVFSDSGATGIRVIRLDRGEITEQDPATAQPNKDMLN